MNYPEAKTLAEELVAAMRPHCQWIEIAGSIRREKQGGIKDIEIVALPKWSEAIDPSDLFGERIQVTNGLFYWATTVQKQVMWIKPGTSEIIPWEINENGRYWRGVFHGVKLDLFLPTPDRLWPTYLIRTGSADFSQALMIRAREVGCRFEDGKFGYLRGGAFVSFYPEAIQTEEDIFECLKIEYVPPVLRTGPEAIRPLRRGGRS